MMYLQVVDGMPLKTGKKLKYRINGMLLKCFLLKRVLFELKYRVQIQVKSLLIELLLISFVHLLTGFLALLISAVAVGVALQQEVDLTYIHTHFLQFFSSAVMISVLLSVYLYTRSRHLSEEEQAPSGNSGECNSAIDFFFFYY